MEKSLTFICSDNEIVTLSIDEALNNHSKFNSVVRYEDLFDLSRKVNSILDVQKIPSSQRKFVDIWDISDNKLILRVFGNCYHHYQGNE